MKLPGSVSLVSQTDGSQQTVVGARYTYASLVTSKDQSTHIAARPSQYPPAQAPKKKKSGPLSQSSTASATVNKTASVLQQQRHHRSSSSPHKNFNAFLQDTNDEWSDQLGYDNSTSAGATQSGASTPSHRKALSQTSRPNSKPFSVHDPPPPMPASKPSASSPSVDHSGVKKDIQLLLQVYNMNPDESEDPIKIRKFKEVLSEPNVDLVQGYLPCNSARREATLARKRKEYTDSVAITYARGTAGLDQTLWHQIHIDIPRTNPGVPLYQYEATQLCLERILYQWAIRHPASGYVQGINDLVTPLFEVFLSAYIDDNPEEYDVSQLDPSVLNVIEADSFWCLSKLLDGIQDNYTFAQPGIQRQVATLKELVSRIDGRLAQHLQNEGIEFIQFAFRWMNCLLMRELPLRSTVRMWDTYLAEGSSEGFSEFHVYVCAAFLVKWSEELQKHDFQGVMIFLQQLPTQNWQEKDVELLLSEAYMWKTLFHNAPSHLKGK
ncbi:rab-GTPase-TBC domain-domain-containing protein [Syncephalastrum racemosum]|uniref:Rab-GTPase-TBC domain-domain-containing protein n=1 Tax=Syncephalastrum racemosum TaxID=13706 RepID=A0A1X2H4G3_SYNRA|nr:rab-GTPase-TBC domain-domain-containing protein [Syncephalastrum racemosum]